MPANPSLHTLRQRWEAARQRGKVLSADDLCRDCPELLGQVRAQLEQWQLNTGPNPSVSWGLAPENTVSLAPAPLDTAPIVLQPGATPVPGYCLVQQLGQGGFGEVWKALGPGNVQVALKFIRLQGGAGRLESRALELMKQLRHANLLTIAAHWQTDTQLVIAVDLAEGTLLDRLHQYQHAGSQGIPAPELLEYMRDAARGLDYLNEPQHTMDGKSGVGVQHRDVKPANLLLVGGSVKVGDFGLAKLLENTAVTNTSSAMTIAYAAPEMIQKRLHRHSDQYALAVSYCQLCGGRLPFKGDAVQMMYAHLSQPPDLEMLPEVERSIVARALAKEPNERWPSCRAFVEALATAGQKTQYALAGQASEAAPRAAGARSETALEKTVRVSLPPEARRRWLAGAGGLLALAGLTLLWLLLGGNADPGKPPKLAEEDLPKQFENSIGMKLVRIDPGKFLMGSPAAEPEREPWDTGNEWQHEVEITKPFYLGVHEVTQEQYCKVMGNNPSRFTAAGEGQDTSNFPVEQVSWHDAVKFCQKLSALAVEKQAKRTYRLPTEAEWEYACRGGRSSPFHFGNTITSAKANFSDSKLGRTTSVGSYLPNDFGLYDMHGNVWEWCSDWYAKDYYKQSPRQNPQGPQTGDRRVLRGGSWYCVATYCRAAIRVVLDPGVRYNDLFGFRVVCVAGARTP
jgi:formylglycine-generating enzyme required for sulfatase activity